MTMDRRGFITGVLASTALSACTSATTGKVKTFTLDVTKACTYGTYILQFASAALALTFVSAALGPESLLLAQTITAALSQALTAFKADAGPSLTITIDTTSKAALWKSILNDCDTLVTLLGKVIISTTVELPGTVVSDAKLAANAASVLFIALQEMTSTLVKTPMYSSGEDDHAIETIQQFINEVRLVK